jgi:DNA topoisomerase I (EC 5.99.1.2)
VGLITYMRTDSVNLAREAIDDIRHYIQKNFDAGYLPAAPVYFATNRKTLRKRTKPFALPRSRARLIPYASSSPSIRPGCMK